jgi:hypothetical protein
MIFNVEVEGYLNINYQNNDPTLPFYALRIPQFNGSSTRNYYVNVFFKKNVGVPENGLKIRIKGIGKLFKDMKSKVTRFCITEATIEEVADEDGEFEVKSEDVPLKTISSSTELFDNKSSDEFAW